MRIQIIAACLSMAAATLACGRPPTEESEAVTRTTSALTDPVSICNQDPRVNMKMVPLQVCAGARLFFDETFNGNGRTCGTCHPAANNFTIDQAFIASLPASDPLFVFRQPVFDGKLELESDLTGTFALIRENVDGFQDLAHKFVMRSTPHTLSLATSIARDPQDTNTTAAVTERTGWGGDGAPGNGSLRQFVDGAIKQHYPRDNGRTPGSSFRFSTETEKDQLLAFQLALGRTADINLANVTLTDTQAAAGKAEFMDPLKGRCNHCHNNAGANFALTGKNRNFNTGLAGAGTCCSSPTGGVPQPSGPDLQDGGFGGQDQTQPNFAAVAAVPDAFGNGSFNTPPLIEAVDTGPLFHQNGFGNIESGVAFYGTQTFLRSPAAQESNTLFGGPVDVSGTAVVDIARFLRVLNASFNLAIAAQRLEASRTLNIAYWAYRDDIQKGLLKLAAEEVKDALADLAGQGPTFHGPQQTSLTNVLGLISDAVAATDPAVRRDKTASALSAVQSAKSAFGTGMNFTLGTGNLMF